MRNDPLRAVWIAVLAGFLLTAMRIGDILLLKRLLNHPLEVAAWIGALFVWLLVARVAARRVPDLERSRLQHWVADLDAPALVLAAFFLVMLFGFHWGYQRAASDGREYYVQVRSLVMDLDLDFANENATFGVRGTADIYAFGAALLWVPFFVACHLWLGLLNLLGAEHVRDGFFNPYQRAVGLGSLIYGSIGLVLLFRLASQFVSRRLAAAATIVICSGSFLIWYFVIDPSLPHAVSMFTVALFVALWHSSRDERSLGGWVRLGLAGGLMTMVRWQNVAFAILPAADAAWELWRAARGERPRSLSALTRKHFAFGGAFLLAFSPQLLFWKLTRGDWLAIPSGAHAVSWTGPLRDVLFTPDHGLFTWTPILLLALLGFAGFVRRDPRMGALLLVAFASQLYILGTVESPGYGFGARRMANCAVLFVLGLATLLDWLRRRPLVAPAVVMAFLLVWNLVFVANVHDSTLPPTGTVRASEIATAFVRRVGNPLSLPMNLWFAWRYETDLGHYERLGTQTFNNLRLDIGSPGDDRFLSRGWSGPEEADFTFRWNEGPASSLLVRLKASAPYRLVLRAAPLEHPDGRVQAIEVVVNGEPVARFELSRGLRQYTVPIPATHLVAGVNRLQLRYAWIASPRSLGLSNDERLLGVQFDRIRLLRD